MIAAIAYQGCDGFVFVEFSATQFRYIVDYFSSPSFYVSLRYVPTAVPYFQYRLFEEAANESFH
jgi:hypothetical protein